MSLLDVQYPELDLFLQGWRRRLNRVVIASEGLRALVVAAPVSAVATLVITRVPAQRWLGWAASSALLAGAWVALRWRRRLTPPQAAAWLDERSGAQGLFGAAAACLGLDKRSALQRQVLDDANRRRTELRGAASPTIPAQRLLLRALLALTLVGASAALLGIDVPRPGAGSAAAAAQTPSKQATPPSPTPDSDARELSPREAAQRLFPEDQRLAALAEQALASGDPGALDALLEQNAAARGGGAGAPSQPQGGNSQQQKGETDRPSEGEPGERAPGGSAQPGAGNSRSSDSSKPGSNDSKGSGQGQRPGQPSGGSAPPAETLGGAGGQGRTSSEGGGAPTPFTSGGAPGIGHSEQPLGLAGRPGTGGKSLPLKEPGAMGLFEYVLPGSEAKRPTADTVASSARSAEAVLSRSSPPLEFENTIRDYFLSLSQEATP